MKILKYLAITYVTQAVCCRLYKDISWLIDECKKIDDDNRNEDSKEVMNDRKETGPLDRIGF